MRFLLLKLLTIQSIIGFQWVHLILKKLEIQHPVM
jgi:hypothetical protein